MDSMKKWHKFNCEKKTTEQEAGGRRGGNKRKTTFSMREIHKCSLQTMYYTDDIVFISLYITFNHIIRCPFGLDPFSNAYLIAHT